MMIKATPKPRPAPRPSALADRYAAIRQASLTLATHAAHPPGPHPAESAPADLPAGPAHVARPGGTDMASGAAAAAEGPAVRAVSGA